MMGRCGVRMNEFHPHLEILPTAPLRLFAMRSAARNPTSMPS
jgi:hypothetical protein